MIATRRLQRHFADGFIAEAVEDLWEPWMRHADKAWEDDTLLRIVQQELAVTCGIILPLKSQVEPLLGGGDCGSRTEHNLEFHADT